MGCEREGNILFRGLPPDMNFVELGQWLERSPRPGPWRPYEAKLEIESIFVASHSVVEIAAGVLDMMCAAAVAQDPRVLENRLRVTRVAEVLEAPASPMPGDPYEGLVMGMCVKGITGVGKSRIFKRLLGSIAQVVEHENDAASHTLYLSQVTHLTIHLSGDGSPVAFLTGALASLDKVLGTTYLEDALKRRASVNTLLLIFMSKLVLHRVLLLVVEEAQQRNLDFTRYKAAFQSLFLHALNFGIPVVLVGNPAGINPLLESSQVRRRLTAGGDYRLDPVFDWRDAEWRLDIVPAIWGASPFSEPDAVWCSYDDLCQFLWDETGGFKSHLASLRTVALKIALRAGSCRVETGHVNRALLHPEFIGCRPLAQAFATRDVPSLHKFADADAAYYQEVWEALTAAEAPSAASARTDDAAGSERRPATATEAAGATGVTGVLKGETAPSKGEIHSDAIQATQKCEGSASDVKPAAGHNAPSANDCRSDAWLAKLPSAADR